MKFFTIRELTKSTTAQQKGIKNIPSKEQEQNLIALIENILDPLREAYGKPIVVTSGYRCPALNKAIGGAKNSQHCFDKNTEILTNNGWRTYQTIQESDEVLTLNLSTQLLEYKKIENIMRYYYKGELIFAENQHVSFAVTPEHRMVCRIPSHKYVRKTDRVLTKAEKQYFNSLKTNNDQFHIEIANDIINKRRIFKTAGISSYKNIYDINVLRLCMATISDGFIQKKNTNSPSIGFNLKKERDKQELEDILRQLEMSYTKNYSYTHEKQGIDGVYQYYINGTNSREVLSIISLDKKIPKWFLYLDPSILRQLIITYAKFDGNFDKRKNCNGVTIFSKDEENIDMLQNMSILCGMRCVKKHFTNLEVNIKGKINVIPHFYHLYITQNTDESRVNENKYSRIDYNDIVWCINNSNTTLVTRRNGKISIQGNCQGQATDIRTVEDTRAENKKLFDLIQKLKLPFDQLIDEHNLDWIHVSYSNRNRRQVLTIK